MGTSFSSIFAPHLWREDEPDCLAPYKYDPQFGFDDKRKERHLPATEAEMDSANLEPNVRDFCGKLRIEYRGCISKYGIVWYKCKGLLHELEHCYLEEHIRDMKEFEREKRLNARERRLTSQQ